MSLDIEIVSEFMNESKELIKSSIELLEEIEGYPEQSDKLQIYGNSVDRIMGGSKNLALLDPTMTAFEMIGNYTALLKAVGYKSSHIKNNPQFFNISVALLLDATETLEILLSKINLSSDELKSEISETFIERVRWISKQFNENYSGTVGTGTSSTSQSEIDDLMKKLGL